MKVKTSITLSEEILAELNKINKSFKNRSNLIEQALQQFVVMYKKQKREESDLKILNQNSKRLNEEAEDVLSYQVKW